MREEIREMSKIKSSRYKVQALMLSTLMLTLTGFPVNAAEAKVANEFDQLNQDEIIKEMGAGWNLGNTMEAFSQYGPNEEMWGNPKVTPELFEAVKAAGFDTVRIPVTLLSAIDSAPEYKIDSAWLNRVKEVVDYAYNAGLYVILDGVHGDGYHTIDGAWLLVTDQDQEKVKDKYQKVWQQYAEMFKDYDEHLIFESMNEVFDGNYSNPDTSLYKNLNAYNQVFVDTIRQSGGNNAERWLLVPGWNTSIDQTAGNYGFELPTDSYRSDDIPSDEQRIMISAHYYSPYEFTLDNSSWITQWGSIATDESKKSSWGQEDYLDSQLEMMNEAFVKKGYPVVIGEYCATDKSDKDADNNTYRAYFAKMVSMTCKKYGAIPVYWDIGAQGPGGSCLIDRRTYQIVNQPIVEAIMTSIKGSTTPVDPTDPVDPPVNPPVDPVDPPVNPPVDPVDPPVDSTEVMPSVEITTTVGNSINQTCTITSTGSNPVELSKLAIRYYYSKDGNKDQNFWCDNAGLQLNVAPYYTSLTSDVKGTFYDDYLEITFDTSEQLTTGTGSLNLGMRFAQADWSSYSNFVDNGYEVYYNGVKVEN